VANLKGILNAAGDGPLTFGQRLAGDPRIARVIEGNLPALSQIDPQLAARLQQRDPEAIFEAYQMIVGSGGRLKAPAPAEPFSAVDAPARQMDLGLSGDNEMPSRAMIPFGTRGPGVPVGQPMGPGMRGDNVAVHNTLRDSWPAPYDADAGEVMGELGSLSPQQQQYLRALEADDWLGFDYPSQAASAGLQGDAVRRYDMSPDAIAARQSLLNTQLRGPGTARDVRGDMILSRLRGIGTNAAPLYNPGREMIPAPMRGLPFTPSQPARIMGPQEQIAAQFDRALGVPERGLSVPDRPMAVTELPPSPQIMRGESLGVPDDGIPRAPRSTNSVTPPPKRPSKMRDVAAAGAAAAGGAALVNSLAPVGDDTAASLNTGGEADLAAETRPAPVVEATPEKPEPTVLQAPPQPVDYSLEARKLIDQLNNMRRAAGGEVPEAPAMQREIQRLLDLGNKTRKATYVAAPQDDAGRLYQQAQGLIDQVNQMYRQGMTPNSPQVRQIMAKVRQLQSQGDAIRNRRSA
jgi:hypothetical protein